jgi:hypothetical protein
MSLVIVGELNPYGDKPEHALFPYPENSAGGRLCFKILGIRRTDYVSLTRYNLCVGKWSMVAAKKRALEITKLHSSDTLVLCGKKVQLAFHSGNNPSPVAHGVWRDGYLICIPHPSGLCREWNVPGTVEKVRDAVRARHPELWREPTEADYGLLTEPSDA